MDTPEIRLRCLEAAVGSPAAKIASSDPNFVVNLATQFYNFVISGEESPSKSKKKADKPTDILS